jgi:preprotein translocase subunit YajC
MGLNQEMHNFKLLNNLQVGDNILLNNAGGNMATVVNIEYEKHSQSEIKNITVRVNETGDEHIFKRNVSTSATNHLNKIHIPEKLKSIIEQRASITPFETQRQNTEGRVEREEMMKGATKEAGKSALTTAAAVFTPPLAPAIAAGNTYKREVRLRKMEKNINENTAKINRCCGSDSEGETGIRISPRSPSPYLPTLPAASDLTPVKEETPGSRGGGKRKKSNRKKKNKTKRRKKTKHKKTQRNKKTKRR